jgi:CheY-like chemotaxis protein
LTDHVERAHASGGAVPALVVVDPNRRARTATEAALVRRFEPDYRVITTESAETGLATLQRLATDNEDVALVAADLRLPGTDGVAFLGASPRSAPTRIPSAVAGDGSAPHAYSSNRVTRVTASDEVRELLSRNGAPFAFYPVEASVDPAYLQSAMSGTGRSSVWPVPLGKARSRWAPSIDTLPAVTGEQRPVVGVQDVMQLEGAGHWQRSAAGRTQALTTDYDRSEC